MIVIALILGIIFMQKSNTPRNIVMSPKDTSDTYKQPTFEGTTLNEVNGSKKAGIAGIAETKNGGIIIKISMSYPDKETVTMVKGTCAEPGAVLFSLNPMTKQNVDTTVEMSEEELEKQFPVALTIRNSKNDMVSCGDFIPENEAEEVELP